MAPINLERDFLLSLRTFCCFVNNLKNLKDIHGNSLRSLQTGNKTKEAFDYLVKITNFNDDLNKENFFNFCEKIFEQFNKRKFMDSSLHLDKDNYCIVETLNSLISLESSDFVVYEEETIDFLRIIHSKLISVFNKASDSSLEKIFYNRFDDKFENYLQNKQKDDSYISEIDDYLIYASEGIEIRRNFNKLLRYKNHMNLIEYHNGKKTTPKEFFYCQFPKPYPDYNSEFVDEHNKIIETAQESFMKLMNKFFESKCNEINDQILNLKEKIIEKQEELRFDIDDLVKRAKHVEQHDLNNYFMRSKYKADRCKQMKYAVIEKSKSLDNTTRSNNESVYKKQNQSYRSNNYNRNNRRNYFNRSRNNSSGKNVSFNDSDSYFSNNDTSIESSQQSNYPNNYRTRSHHSNGLPSILKNHQMNTSLRFNNRFKNHTDDQDMSRSTNQNSNSNSQNFRNGKSRRGRN